MKTLLGPALDMALRSCTIAARAIFIFVVAKVLTLDEFGTFAYLQASTSLLLYVAGGDFHMFAHRELLANRCSLPEMLKSQSLFLAVSVSVVCAIAIVASQGTVAQSRALMLVALLVGETLTAELVRVLITAQRPTAANIVNFLKSAGWMLPIIAWSATGRHTTLDNIVVSWTIGLAVAVSVALMRLPCSPAEVLHSAIPSGFYRRALKILPIILVGTIALRAAFSLDRMLIERFLNTASVGIYAFYAGCAAAYLAMLDAGIMTRLYPLLVEASAALDIARVRELQRRMTTSAFVSGLVALVVYIALISPALGLIGKPQFSGHAMVGAVLIIAYTVYGASMGPHYVLYGRHEDTFISITHAASCAMLLTGSAVAAWTGNILFIALGVAGTFFWQYLAKANRSRLSLSLASAT